MLVPKRVKHRREFRGKMRGEAELKKELFELRFQAAAGRLENTAKLDEVKKTIARVKTVQRELTK